MDATTTRKDRRAASRKARSIVRERARTNRAASRIARRGNGCLATHALAQGLGPKEARSMAGSLRRCAERGHIRGTEVRVHAGRRMRNAQRFTPAQVAVICDLYKPRKRAFVLAAVSLRLAA